MFSSERLYLKIDLRYYCVPVIRVLPVEGTHPPWAQRIIKYMTEHALLEDDHEAGRVARQAKLYILIDGKLYRRHENGVKLRCIPQEQGQALLKDIHEGTCSSHVVSRSLAGKVFRQGFVTPQKFVPNFSGVFPAPEKLLLLSKCFL